MYSCVGQPELVMVLKARKDEKATSKEGTRQNVGTHVMRFGLAEMLVIIIVQTCYKL